MLQSISDDAIAPHPHLASDAHRDRIAFFRAYPRVLERRNQAYTRRLPGPVDDVPKNSALSVALRHCCRLPLAICGVAFWNTDSFGQADGSPYVRLVAVFSGE